MATGRRFRPEDFMRRRERVLDEALISVRRGEDLERLLRASRRTYDELLDHSKAGVVHLPGAIDEGRRRILISEIEKLMREGMLSEAGEPGSSKHFYSTVFGLFHRTAEQGREDITKASHVPEIQRLEEVCREGIYNNMARETGQFPAVRFLSVGVYIWPAGTGGTDFHRDSNVYTPIIVGAFSGAAEISFRGADGREATMVINGGDMYVMRAGVEHAVRVVGHEDRYAIVLRHVEKAGPGGI